jgi:hypothetical protein
VTSDKSHGGQRAFYGAHLADTLMLEVAMIEPDPTDNPVATDVHVAAPGRLKAVRRRDGIMRTVYQRIPALGRMRGSWERAKRAVVRTIRRKSPFGRRASQDGG